MKRPTHLLCLAIVATQSFCARALDLTPHFTNEIGDMVSARHPFFYDGLKRFAVTIDRETEVSFNGGACFRFTSLAGAAFHIRFSPLTPDLSFKEEDLKTYRATAMGLVPSGATDVTIVGEEANSLVVNDWKSHQFVLSYKLPGRELRMGVIFLNLNPKLQLLLQANAAPSDFDAAFSRALHIIRSWHEMLPDEGKPAAGT